MEKYFSSYFPTYVYVFMCTFFKQNTETMTFTTLLKLFFFSLHTLLYECIEVLESHSSNTSVSRSTLSTEGIDCKEFYKRT